MEEQRKALGEQVRLARLRKGWSKERAARVADISSITWKRVEEGLGVQDTSRWAVLSALGLDEQGQPLSVEAKLQDYVTRRDGDDEGEMREEGSA